MELTDQKYLHGKEVRLAISRAFSNLQAAAHGFAYFLTLVSESTWLI
jgi:hypothetical protein